MRLLRCPKCYEEIAETARQCQFCKVHLTMAEDRSRFFFTKVTCPRCHQFNLICHRYCSLCALPMTKHCPSCGFETLFDSRTCGRCKHFFDQAPLKRRKKQAIPQYPSGSEPIPATSFQEKRAELPVDEILLDSSSQRILVVDDEPFIGKLVKTVLELEGFGVEVAESVAKAREIVAESQPSLVITDIMMPEEDGYSLLKDLKSKTKTRPIKVIMLSVLSEFEDIRRSTISGAVDHIAKPFDPAELVWSVKRALGKFASWEKREDYISN